MASIAWLHVVAEEDPSAVWEMIGAARLEPARAVEIGSLELDMRMGRLIFDRGVLVPAAPVGGQTAEMVFVGDGRFTLAPPDSIEEAQLELFTGQTSLDVSVDRAVLVVGNPETATQLLDRETVELLNDEVQEEAVEIFEAWVGGAERPRLGADAAVLGSVLGDVDARAFFVAWMRSEEIGDFYYWYDPAQREQVTLGQFVAIEADYREEHRIRRLIERQKRRGRATQLRFEDLGDWDTWISSALHGEDGTVLPGSGGVEASRYVLDVTVTPADETVKGTARIAFSMEKEGKRVLSLSLNSDLKVSAVTGGVDEPWPWFRRGNRLYVVPSDATPLGQPLKITVDYHGLGLVELEKGKTYRQVDTWAWYPRIGDVDRATYDVTLRWPKNFQLLASGKTVERGTEAGMQWERRTLDLPASAFSYEIGKFEIESERIGHVDLTVGFNKASGGIDKNTKEEIMATFREALPFLEETFGEYSLDYLTVATIPRPFSQGYLGFVTLSQSVARMGSSKWAVDYQKEPKTEIIAHELSHQWWGNLLGWRTYRDQWLSEALADYSAALFTAQRAERRPVYLARRARQWKGTLSRRTKEGRTVESLGPVVMGSRLFSSHSSSAYSAVVYDKGSVVFMMLARILGEDAMNEMLRNLAERAKHREIDTRSFLLAIERMSGYDLGTFADQFIYGTGIPEIYYVYDFRSQNDGSWIIEGKARQVSTGHFKYILRRTSSGTWFVPREKVGHSEAQPSAFVVPFQIVLASPEETSSQRRKRDAGPSTGRGLGGRMLLRREVSDFSVGVPEEPKEFWLDQRGEVLARFYCERRAPKRMLRYRAYELLGTSEFDETERLLRRALGAPLVPEGGIEDYEFAWQWWGTSHSKKAMEREARFEDCYIHLLLAQLYLERERDSEARAALETAESMLRGVDAARFRGTRAELRAHLAVRAGDYKSAYSILSKRLRLSFPAREGESIVDVSRRRKFRTGRRRWGDGLDYALLAVSAFETGHEEVAAQALKEAEKRNADMGPLRELIEE